MKARRQLRHNLTGCDRRDTERLAKSFLDALPVHDGTAGTKRVRKVLLDLVVQLGGVMEAQQQREHAGELEPPTNWTEFDATLSQRARM